MSAKETNISNWREPDHNVWGFQNVDKILNTQTIKKGHKTLSLDSTPLNFDAFKIDLRDKPSLDLAGFLSATETDGLVVVKDGKIVYEKYDRTNTEGSKHIMMSMTKSVTGIVAGILSEQGKLDVNALVPTYVPEIHGTPFEHVTVRQCLDMRSGIVYADANQDYRAATGWNPIVDGEKETNLHEFISTFSAPATPKIDGLDGAPFEYVSVNTDLMGWILERASGKKFAELVSELIWQPMGAESDALMAVDRAGNARTAGGMCATVRDIARFGRLVLHGGDGIIPKSWIGDMLYNGSKEAWAAGSWKRGLESVLGSPAYRSYWVGDSSSQMLVGLGIHGQMLFVDRKNGIVLAKTSSQPVPIDMEKIVLTIMGCQAFQRVLTEELKN